ncbi:D-ribose pyranase [Mobilicoccus pelagius]|uniref:D-ribose pyranase n=1 Tax=Mobilicoccus pelagius NBRC 104925 TaxID=1089455 RepID=H5UVN7_9MICO|nr:D-ribose pyranase [Mobilicoccus pelagius]GAB49795.1 high affinity ribose transport protein RbsD [Mobilicoccus pelagius NBRC 104925]
MKRRGIVHAELSRQIALLGHTDRVVVGDMGLPLPRSVPVVDLALLPGIPRFIEVLDALLDEIVVESHTVARESLDGQAGRWFDARADRLGTRAEVTHDELKRMTASAAFAVRTGEATPYSNVVLHCGVPF